MRVKSRSSHTPERLTLSASAESATVGMLKETIASKLQMAGSDFRLVVRQPNIPHLHQLPDSTTLHSLGLRNGDLILVDEKVTEETPKTEPRPSDSPTTRPIVEDEVDTVIRKQDGWIKRPRSRLYDVF